MSNDGSSPGYEWCGEIAFSDTSLRKHAAYQMALVDRAYRLQQSRRLDTEQSTNWYDQGLEAYREAKKAEFAARYLQRIGKSWVRQVGTFGRKDLKSGQCVRVRSGAPIVIQGSTSCEQRERYDRTGYHRRAERSYVVQLSTVYLSFDQYDYDYDSLTERDWKSIELDIFQRVCWESGSKRLITNVNHVEIL